MFSRKIMFDMLTILAVSTLVVAGLATPSQAQCTDYSDAFHWTGGVDVLASGWANCFAPIQVGDYAYVIDYFRGLHVLDMRKADSPTLIVTVGGCAQCYSIVAADGWLYAVGPQALYVFDATQPELPVLAGWAPNAGGMEVVVAGARAYVAGFTEGLKVVDISNPRSPVLLGQLGLSGSAMGLAVRGNLAYVSIRHHGLAVVDVGNAASPSLVGYADFGDECRGVALVGDYAFVAATLGGVWSVDVKDSRAPVVVDNIYVAGYPTDIGTIGTTLIVTNRDLALIDAADPTQLRSLGDHITPGSSIGLCTRGNEVLVADGRYVGIYDLGGPRTVNEGAFSWLPGTGEAYDVEAASGYGFLACETSGLVVVDVNDPRNPLNARSVLGLGTCREVEMADNALYVAGDATGLTKVDVSVPLSPTKSGSVALNFPVCDMDLDDGRLAVACGYAGVRVYATAGAWPPPPPLRFTTPCISMGVALVGDLLCVASDSAGFQVVDLTRATEPLEPNVMELPTRARHVAATRDVAYVTGFDDQIYVFDISEANALKLLRTLPLPYAGENPLKIVDAVLYVGVQSCGVLAFDIRDPRSPNLLGVANARYAYDFHGLAIDRGYVFAAAGSKHLRVLPAQCAVQTGTEDVSPVVVDGGRESGARLLSAFPNPFNPMTTVRFALSAEGPLHLAVFDVRGHAVCTLVAATMPPGSYEVTWDGRDACGRDVASGTYLARLEFGGKVESMRLALVR